MGYLALLAVQRPNRRPNQTSQMHSSTKDYARSGNNWLVYVYIYRGYYNRRRVLAATVDLVYPLGDTAVSRSMKI